MDSSAARPSPAAGAISSEQIQRVRDPIVVLVSKAQSSVWMKTSISSPQYLRTRTRTDSPSASGADIPVSMSAHCANSAGCNTSSNRISPSSLCSPTFTPPSSSPLTRDAHRPMPAGHHRRPCGARDLRPLRCLRIMLQRRHRCSAHLRRSTRLGSHPILSLACHRTSQRAHRRLPRCTPALRPRYHPHLLLCPHPTPPPAATW